MKQPNYAPVYAALYPDFAQIFRKHGYALMIHGTLARDFDLMAIVWVAKPSSIDTVLSELIETFSLKQIGEPELKAFGRLAYTISIGHGECSIDLSFLSPKNK